MATTYFDQKLPAQIRRLGVPVTLGASSTYGLVAAADAELLQSPDRPAALLGRAIVVTVLRDTLTGLRPTVVLAIGDGPLAGNYVVDRILAGADGAIVRFTAFPTAEASAGLWARGHVLLPWASRGAGAADGSPFHVGSLEHGPVIVLDVRPGAEGPDPELVVSILAAADEAGPFEPTGIAFAPVGAFGDIQALTLPGDLADAWIVLDPAVSGGDETTEFLCGAVLLDVAVPGS